jgi:formate/nitrite transporter
MEKKPLKPQEIMEYTIDTAVTKAQSGFVRLAILGFLAGAFIAFAAEGSNMAAFGLLASPETYGLGKAVAGVVFPTGLMLVLLAGGELFTGNTLMIGAAFRKKISVGSMLRNWVIVYLFNFVGSIFMAWLINASGQLHGGADLLGAVTIKIAAGKTGLEFSQAFILGILCNWLVCLAVWISYGADTLAGKILGIFFPISLFITSGFEHSVANMYYIPAGIFAKANPAFLGVALEHGVTQGAIDALNWQNFFIGNLIPVTLGNIVGGSFLVMTAYLLAYRGTASRGAKRSGASHGKHKK